MIVAWCAWIGNAPSALASDQDLPELWAAQRAEAELTAQPPASAPAIPAEGATTPPWPYGRDPNYVLPIYEVSPSTVSSTCTTGEVGAAVISPPTGFNRFAFGDRFKGVFDSHDPVTYSRLSLGFSGTAQNASGT